MARNVVIIKHKVGKVKKSLQVQSKRHEGHRAKESVNPRTRLLILRPLLQKARRSSLRLIEKVIHLSKYREIVPQQLPAAQINDAVAWYPINQIALITTEDLTGIEKDIRTQGQRVCHSKCDVRFEVMLWDPRNVVALLYIDFANISFRMVGTADCQIGLKGR